MMRKREAALIAAVCLLWSFSLHGFAETALLPCDTQRHV